MSETVDKRRLTELRSLLRTIEEAGWEYARVEIDGVVLVVSADAGFAASEAGGSGSSAPPDAQAEPAQPREREAPEWPDHPSPPTATESHPTEHSTDPRSGPVETVTSPTIGLFWRSPKPGAPPFVEVGDTVAPGDTVCIIEVMKLMTHVTAPVAGTVQSIHIENGSMVEHGTALIDIAPSDGPA